MIDFGDCSGIEEEEIGPCGPFHRADFPLQGYKVQMEVNAKLKPLCLEN